MPTKFHNPEWFTHPDRHCAGIGPTGFDDSPRARRFVAEAKATCQGCPVKPDCLEHALAKKEPWGVWGGFTTIERDRLLAGAKPSWCETCMLSYVGNQCKGCTQTHVEPVTGGSVIRALIQERDRLAHYMSQGYRDWHLAEHFSMEFDQVVTTYQVSEARHALGLLYDRGGNRKHTTLCLSYVDDVEQTRGGFGKLSRPEQFELLRRWLIRRGATLGGFAHAYAVPMDRARILHRQYEEAKAA